MQEGWIKIHTAGEEYQANVIKSLLENNGLSPVVMDKKDDEFRIGHVEVYISAEEAERARKIIADNVE